jgi:hypothetical protein
MTRDTLTRPTLLSFSSSSFISDADAVVGIGWVV